MKKIATLSQLDAACKNRKAVICNGWGMKVRPAAFIINLPASVVLSMMRNGMAIYEKPDAPKPARRFHKAAKE